MLTLGTNSINCVNVVPISNPPDTTPYNNTSRSSNSNDKVRPRPLSITTLQRHIPISLESFSAGIVTWNKLKKLRKLLHRFYRQCTRNTSDITATDWAVQRLHLHKRCRTGISYKRNIYSDNTHLLYVLIVIKATMIYIACSLSNLVEMFQIYSCQSLNKQLDVIIQVSNVSNQGITFSMLVLCVMWTRS